MEVLYIMFGLGALSIIPIVISERRIKKKNARDLFFREQIRSSKEKPFDIRKDMKYEEWYREAETTFAKGSWERLALVALVTEENPRMIRMPAQKYWVKRFDGQGPYAKTYTFFGEILTDTNRKPVRKYYSTTTTSGTTHFDHESELNHRTMQQHVERERQWQITEQDRVFQEQIDQSLHDADIANQQFLDFMDQGNNFGNPF